MNLDFSDLLRALNDEKVEYLIVGGYAVGQHTEPRYTKDLDIWINNSLENADRVFRALSNFGAPMSGMAVEDFTDPQNYFQIGIEPCRIDILMGLNGMDFDASWKKRVTADIDATQMYLISIDDLIENKERTARPQDLIDAARLKQKLQMKID